MRISDWSSDVCSSDLTRAVNQLGNRMFKQVVATKQVQPAGHVDAGEPFEGSREGEPTLKRTLTGTQVIMLGIGAGNGAGIFVLTGQEAAEYAGPAVMLSIVFDGRARAIAGPCYAEVAEV